MTTVRITKLERHPLGFFTAHVTAAESDAVRVDNRIGCWTLPANPRDDFTSNRIARREIIPEIAEKLHKRVRQAQRGEQQTDEAVSITRNGRPNTKSNPTRELAERLTQAALAAVKEAA